jgi:hypothetical protein
MPIPNQPSAAYALSVVVVVLAVASGVESPQWDVPHRVLHRKIVHSGRKRFDCVRVSLRMPLEMPQRRLFLLFRKKPEAFRAHMNAASEALFLLEVGGSVLSAFTGASYITEEGGSITGALECFFNCLLIGGSYIS